MIWLNPLAWLSALVVVPIMLLYFLKLRRPRYPVSSTLLWRRALDDIQANTPWQRLRLRVLLFLQLLVVLALVAALAHPAYSQTRSFPGDLVVIVDESPGMEATDVFPSRFGAALDETRRLASQLSGGNVLSVIGMGAQPHLVVDESNDPSVIGRGIGRLNPGVSRPDFVSALSLASSLARNGRQTQVVVLVSRDTNLPEGELRTSPVAMPFSLEIVRLGGQLRDLGITAFHVFHSAGRTEAALTVRNYGARPAMSDLDLYADGQLADVRPLTVASGVQQTLFWTQLPGATRRLQARLIQQDDVRFDKTAQAVLPPTNVRRVLLVDEGDYWLRAVLALEHSFSLSTVTPSRYAPGRAAGFDLVIFDGYLPRALPPTASLLIAPPAGHVSAFRFGAAINGGSITAAPLPSNSTFSSLLQYVDLSDVHVTSGRRVQMPVWMQPLITSRGTPLVAAGQGGTGRVALIAFALQNSDWPLRISYPIVMHNLLVYLTPRLALTASNLEAGQPLGFNAGALVREIDITKPDGRVVRLHAPFGSYADTVRPGFYTVRETGAGTVPAVMFAVNLFAGHGSSGRGPSVTWFGATRGGTRVVRVHVGIAWMVALAALGLLSAEWWLAWRR